ncbi:hypothetical protein M5K25_010315 [Dendrobium thyrsiflorum]|uniref:Retrotransposon gag protein n=1 Tax=Dendrobium thyrsiflorum TaxID=117978 RepID=A0ABD0V778_DENTH
MQVLQQRKDQEITQLNARLDEMSNTMKELFRQLGFAAVVGRPPTTNFRENVENPTLKTGSTQAAHLDPDVPNEETEVQEPMLTMLKDDEIVSKTQIEDLINQKVKAVIAIETTEALAGTGHQYPIEYDQVKYPKGYVVPQFKTFFDTENPRQHLVQFKATYSNIEGNDVLLLRQFISNLTSTTFEWYTELPNDSIKTFDELETMFVKRFTGATKKMT